MPLQIRGELNIAYQAEIARLRALLREAFTAGMLAGHHRTVDGTMPSDADGRTDEADCWLHENGIVTFDLPNAPDQRGA